MRGNRVPAEGKVSPMIHLLSGRLFIIDPEIVDEDLVRQSRTPKPVPKAGSSGREMCIVDVRDFEIPRLPVPIELRASDHVRDYEADISYVLAVLTSNGISDQAKNIMSQIDRDVVAVIDGRDQDSRAIDGNGHGLLNILDSCSN